MRRFESHQCFCFFFFIFIASYFHMCLLSIIGKQLAETTFNFHYAQVRIPSMLSFLFLHFYCIIFSHVSFKHYWKTVLTFIQSVHQMGHYQTQKRGATELINSIGYALFAVIKAIFSNPNVFGNDYELYL